MVASRIIRPIALPDATEMKSIGYADDTTIIMRDDRSLLEAFNLISKFEKAMGSKLNINKTKIYGISNWKNRYQWPIDDLQNENEYFYALGIYHSNEYNKAIDKNWSVILEKMKKHVNILLNRKLTLHQRVSYANTCLMSKIWYTAHIYPLPDEHAKNFNKVLFQYIWGGNYEPIRRSTVCRPKNEGGLSVINCLVKAQTLMVKSFIKCYTHDSYRNSLMLYYCHIRISAVLPSMSFAP